PRHGLPSFRQLLVAIAGAYKEQREDVAQQATALVDAIRKGSTRAQSTEPLTPELLDQAVAALRTQYEPMYGGFGRAPKFPPASVLEFLLRRSQLDVVRGTLDGMSAGGMYDLVGGGFHRYSVDDRWLIPHFEKMLYDNAQLAPAYLHAWLVTGEDRYRAIAESTIEYLLRELLLPEGGFASAQDAD